MKLISIPDDPHNVTDDYCRPPQFTWQWFIWKDDRCAWRINLSPDHRAEAGFILRRPVDLSGHYSRGVLRFRMRPVKMARRLYIALVSRGGLRGTPVMVSTPLAGHEVARREGWGYYMIDLHEFGDARSLPELGAPAASDAPTVPMNWEAVQEVRIGTRKEQNPGGTVAIRDLKIGSPWPPH